MPNLLSKKKGQVLIELLMVMGLLLYVMFFCFKLNEKIIYIEVKNILSRDLTLERVLIKSKAEFLQKITELEGEYYGKID